MKKEYEQPEILIIDLAVDEAICVSNVTRNSGVFKEIFDNPDEVL